MEIVLVVNDWGEVAITSEEREVLEGLLNDIGYQWRDESGVEPVEFEVRGSRQGEAEGTYYVRRDGTLQILGYSIPVPEDLHRVIQESWDALIDWGRK
jgi:hypothetical protein